MATWVASRGIRISTATTRNTEAGLIKTAPLKAHLYVNVCVCVGPK